MNVRNFSSLSRICRSPAASSSYCPCSSSWDAVSCSYAARSSSSFCFFSVISRLLARLPRGRPAVSKTGWQIWLIQRIPPSFLTIRKSMLSAVVVVISFVPVVLPYLPVTGVDDRIQETGYMVEVLRCCNRISAHRRDSCR